MTSRVGALVWEDDVTLNSTDVVGNGTAAQVATVVAVQEQVGTPADKGDARTDVTGTPAGTPADTPVGTPVVAAVEVVEAVVEAVV